MSGSLGLAASAAGLPLFVGLAYVGIGAAVALVLARRGVPSTTALSALGCWPLLLPLLSSGSVRRSPGPFAERIADGLAALRQTMSDPAAEDVALPDDLDGLVDDLRRADERLAMVDHLLHTVAAERQEALARGDGRGQGDGEGDGEDDAERGSEVGDCLQTLRRARASAAAEVEAVLDGIVQLRLQIGLRSLAGNSVPVRERLRDLRARLAAVDEIAALELRTS